MFWSYYKEMKAATFDKLKKVIKISQQERLEEEARVYKRLEKSALKFFKKETLHIEISRAGNLEKVYFPHLPYCKTLPKNEKTDFHE